MNFPFRNDKWVLVMITGFFMFFVLFLYKGFNIEQGSSLSGHSLFARSLTFALTTSLTFWFHEFLVGHRIKKHKKIHILWWRLWEVFIAGTLVFLVYNYFWQGTEFYWTSYFLLLFEFFLVMVIPLLIYEFLQRNITNKTSSESYTFRSQNQKEKVMILADDILYLTSEDNYIEIFYVSESSIKSEILRNTLKNIEEQLPENSDLHRCHRSYMVNFRQITKLHRKNRKLLLTLKGGVEIPVSDKYAHKFTEWLKG